MNIYDETLAKLGLSMPSPALPVANYLPYVISGKQVFISGQVPVAGGQIAYAGKLGQGLSIEEGQQAARLCALNILAMLKYACDGDLDRVVRCVRLGGFINCAADFTDQPKVMNGASDLIVAVFGDRGRHARTTIGVNSLPQGCAVEVDAIFEIN